MAAQNFFPKKVQPTFEANKFRAFSVIAGSLAL